MAIEMSDQLKRKVVQYMLDGSPQERWRGIRNLIKDERVKPELRLEASMIFVRTWEKVTGAL
jgi:hypothetical protein